jgi:hypothetical protein
MLNTLINFATQLQFRDDEEAETEPLLCADAEAEAVPLLCADAEAEPRRSERIKRRRENEDTPLRQQQGKRMRADDVQDEEDEDDEEDASEADVPEPKAAEVEERDFEETATAPPSSEQPPKKRDQSGKCACPCRFCATALLTRAQRATGASRARPGASSFRRARTASSSGTRNRPARRAPSASVAGSRATGRHARSAASLAGSRSSRWA